MNSPFIFNFKNNDLPIMATAIHAGRKVRPELSEIMAIQSSERFREEDPFTGFLTRFANVSVIVRYSRFEVDLNRGEENAVYRTPEDCWGIKLWKRPPGDYEIASSLALYKEFYQKMEDTIELMIQRFPRLLVYDLHSYNFRREGPNSEASKELNPEINIGTGSLLESEWRGVVDRLITDFRTFDFDGRHLDVRENVKFKGGEFSQWLNRRFKGKVGAIAIEFKKIFMDEWTGRLNRDYLRRLLHMLESSLPGVIDEI